MNAGQNQNESAYFVPKPVPERKSRYSRRGRYVCIRLTPEGRRNLKKKADQAGLTQCGFVRSALKRLDGNQMSLKLAILKESLDRVHVQIQEQLRDGRDGNLDPEAVQNTVRKYQSILRRIRRVCQAQALRNGPVPQRKEAGLSC